MAECKAWGCTNNKRKHKEKHYFRVPMPSNIERRDIAQQWLHNIGTGYTLKTFPFGSNSLVCEDHFESTCYEVDKVNKLLGLPERRILKKDAVPTIFIHRKSQTDDSRRQRALIREKTREKAGLKKHIHKLTESHVQSTIGYSVAASSSTVTSEDALVKQAPCLNGSTDRLPEYKENVCHAGSQTDPVQIYPCDVEVLCVEPESQILISKLAHPSVVASDHTYSRQPTSESCNVTEVIPDPEDPPLPRSEFVSVTSTPVKSAPRDITAQLTLSPITTPKEKDCAVADCSIDKNDTSWHADAEEESESDSDTSENDRCDYMLFVKEKKYLVFESCLDSVFSLTRCKLCNAPVSSISKLVSGANVVYKVQYLCNDPELVWSAHPYLRTGRRKVAAGNVLVCASTLYSGLTYTRLFTFCELFNLALVSESTYYDIQSSILIPVVGEAWKRERDATVNDVRETNVAVTLAGDGRCDSPGFSAKYCTYSFQDSATGKILDFELVQVTQTTSSQAMEKYGFCRTVDRLLAENINIHTIVTDRHVSIRACMRSNYTGIDHQFDVYHIVNSIRKKLNDIVKYKRHASLVPWVKSILNHVWYSSRMCEGNPDKVVELFTSICYHIAGKHKWSGYKYVHKCLHGRLTSESQKSKLRVKGATLQALKDIIFDKKYVERYPSYQFVLSYR